MRPDDLRSHYLFEPATVDELKALAASLVKRPLPAGTTLFKEGETPSALYIVEFGTIQLKRELRRRQPLVATLGAGSLFGEWGWIDRAGRAASAIAGAAASVWELAYEALDATAAQTPAFRERLLKAMALHLYSRLREASGETLETLLPPGRFV